MKKKISLITVFAILGAAAVLNILLFTILPDKIQEYPAFWMIWSFTFPVNFAFALGLAIYFGLKNGITFIRIPTCYYISWSFSSAYFVAGFILMLIPFSEGKIGIPLAIELALTIAYTVVLMFAFLGVSYIEQNQRHVKQKVFYIRDLKSDIDISLSSVTDAGIKKELEKLSEAIRFSDPMSHSSLADTEAELSSLVRSIVLDARMGESGEELTAKIKKAFYVLEYRNEKCKILK